MKKLTKVSLFIFFLFFICMIIFLFIPPDKKRLYQKVSSVKIYDREGRLLRNVLSFDYKTSVWVDIKDISKNVIVATSHKEDKRFYSHFGIDTIGMIRAIYENIKERKIVSGASTITMQVAKISLNFKKRNIFTKLAEIIYALKLEIHLTKDDILEIYLNRVSYGYQNYGIEAAANFYFKKSAKDLSLGEACIMAIIPASPTKNNPYTRSEKVLKEKEKILKSLLKKGIIDNLSYECAIKEGINVSSQNIIFFAPHFVDYVLTQIKKRNIEKSKIITTLDLNLQEKVEKLLQTTLYSLKGYNVNQGAVLVMDKSTGEILSWVGSREYFDELEGQVQGCLAYRQPGSSIKPFLYILAFLSGISPSYILQDERKEFYLPSGERFAPRNYADRYYGNIRVREALASSLNVPAVSLLEMLGVQRFYNLLKDLGFKGLNKDANFYGLSLALGAVEVTLLEIVNAYRAIAQNGMWEEEKVIFGIPQSEKKKIFQENVAYIIKDILSDNKSRIKAFGDDSPLNLPFPCAVKTGTTKDFKDNWCIGFTERYVIGVWIGNFDSSPMTGVSGISGAAPLFRDIMIELHRNEYPPDFEKSQLLLHLEICAKDGKIAGKNCPNKIEEIFTEEAQPKGICSHHLQKDHKKDAFNISNPQDGDIYKIDPQVSYSSFGIKFNVEASQDIKYVTFKLNDDILCKKRYPFKYIWKPSPGKFKLEVIGEGLTHKVKDSVSFMVLM